MSAIILDGRSLDPKTVERIAQGAAVALDPKCRQAMERGRAIVDRYLREGIPAYGLNTGLGLRSDEPLSDAAAADFAYRTVRGRAQGLGPPLAAEEVDLAEGDEEALEVAHQNNDPCCWRCLPLTRRAARRRA